MMLERKLTIEGTEYKITVSDDSWALCSAYAEGRAVIGLWDPKKEDQPLSPATYVVESMDDIDDEFLERVVRRRYGLPWIIGKTDRLTIREFTVEDCKKIPEEEDGGEEEEVFRHPDSLRDYIRYQYGFYEYGIWALEAIQTGEILGTAGIFPMEASVIEELQPFINENDTPIELGYHIFTPFRGKGYGLESCKAILSYGGEMISSKIYARIKGDNLPSVSLLQKLGFTFIVQTCNESDQPRYLYEWNLPEQRK